MTDWAFWAVLLLAQNASFTLVSRARNSKSLVYHSLASICSNGVYILTLGVSVDKLIAAKQSGSIVDFAAVAAFYTAWAAIGSVAMHYLLMQHVENRKRTP